MSEKSPSPARAAREAKELYEVAAALSQLKRPVVVRRSPLKGGGTPASRRSTSGSGAARRPPARTPGAAARDAVILPGQFSDAEDDDDGRGSDLEDLDGQFSDAEEDEKEDEKKVQAKPTKPVPTKAATASTGHDYRYHNGYGYQYHPSASGLVVVHRPAYHPAGGGQPQPQAPYGPTIVHVPQFPGSAGVPTAAMTKVVDKRKAKADGSPKKKKRKTDNGGPEKKKKKADKGDGGSLKKKETKKRPPPDVDEVAARKKKKLDKAAAKKEHDVKLAAAKKAREAYAKMTKDARSDERPFGEGVDQSAPSSPKEPKKRKKYKPRRLVINNDGEHEEPPKLTPLEARTRRRKLRARHQVVVKLGGDLSRIRADAVRDSLPPGPPLAGRFEDLSGESQAGPFRERRIERVKRLLGGFASGFDPGAYVSSNWTSIRDGMVSTFGPDGAPIAPTKTKPTKVAAKVPPAAGIANPATAADGGEADSIDKPPAPTFDPTKRRKRAPIAAVELEGVVLPMSDDPESRRKRQLIRNRITARISRERKRRALEDARAERDVKRAEIAELRRQLAEVR